MNTQEQAVMQQALDSLRDEPFLDLTTKQRAAMEAMCQALAAPALPLAASVTDDEIDAALRVATTCGDIIGTKEMRRALTAFAAGRAAGAETAAPKGWKLVPMGPTQGMLEAMDAAIVRIAPSSIIWRESVAAAPAPAAQAKRPENCGTSFCSCIECVMPVSKYGGPELQALILAKLTAPVERKPLTVQEINRLWDDHAVPFFGKTGINPIVFARAIEAAIEAAIAQAVQP